MKLQFTKVHGAGNDFIIFKHPEQSDEFFSSIAPALCNRRKGIGADGLLLVRAETGYNFRMVYFNADGSRAEFCGNGARSLVLYTYIEGISPYQMKFVSDVGKHRGTVSDGRPSVSLPNPSDIQLNLKLKEFNFPMHFVNSGVPHAVIFVDNLTLFDVDTTGHAIRQHPNFAPAGTNVNFVCLDDEGISVRTYERGVEAETLACGTGAVAVATVLHQLKELPSPVKLNFPGGLLEVSFDIVNSSIINIMLGGETAIVFSGSIEISAS